MSHRRLNGLFHPQWRTRLGSKTQANRGWVRTKSDVGRYSNQKLSSSSQPQWRKGKGSGQTSEDKTNRTSARFELRMAKQLQKPQRQTGERLKLPTKTRKTLDPMEKTWKQLLTKTRKTPDPMEKTWKKN